MPERIQLRRVKGWRKPEGAVVVARPSKWGNPYREGDYRIDYDDADPETWRRMAVSDFRGCIEGRFEWEDDRTYPSIDDVVAELRGHDLACWCPLEGPDGTRTPCHADVLLVLANPEVSFPWSK